MDDLIAQADFVIVGAGPAGSAAAWRLVNSGRRVVMIDAGDYLGTDAPAAPSIPTDANVSPKLRDPRFAPNFARTRAGLAPVLKNFSLWGMEAVGGLSNAWGGGIAEFNARELGDATLADEMRQSYRYLSDRIRITGSAGDALGAFWGRNTCVHEAPVLHKPLLHLLKSKSTPQFYVGRARSASDDGVHPYNAATTIALLEASPHFTLKENARIDSISVTGRGYRLHMISGGEAHNVEIARGKLLLATGTIMTTKLVLGALNAVDTRLPLKSNPSSAFALLFPEFLFGPAQRNHPPAGEVSFVMQPGTRDYAIANLFTPTIVSPLDIISRIPASPGTARQILKLIYPGLVLGNLFLSGAHSRHIMMLGRDQKLRIAGVAGTQAKEAQKAAEKAIRRFVLGRRGLVLPGSFPATPLGSDIHYAATLPMRRVPGPLQSNFMGEITGLPGMHVIDGATLPSLPARAHTFTIMANADRIAKNLLNNI